MEHRNNVLLSLVNNTDYRNFMTIKNAFLHSFQKISCSYYFVLGTRNNIIFILVTAILFTLSKCPSKTLYCLISKRLHTLTILSFEPEIMNLLSFVTTTVLTQSLCLSKQFLVFFQKIPYSGSLVRRARYNIFVINSHCYAFYSLSLSFQPSILSCFEKNSHSYLLSELKTLNLLSQVSTMLVSRRNCSSETVSCRFVKRFHIFIFFSK